MSDSLEPRLDYEAVGLMCGLEVHQQLLTERKLFCRCPAGRYTASHDGTVLRHMRPTLSELGEYDGTALMEFKTKKNIVYLLNHENVCTYEMDDTPPFPVNQQAVDVAIEQCLMLGCDIVDEVHIARKQYLDGSIPTGFQRTAIVGVNGTLPFRGRTLSITQVSVEEDSCREVSDRGHLIVWRTDRLGMPLIETVTGPDLRTPDEVAEAILLVGRVCRSTGHVRVGMGASRQDVNVSVRGGRRVEIKGVPQAGWAPRLVHGEAWRQVNLLRLRDELHRRGLTRRGGPARRGDGRHRAVRRLAARAAARGGAGSASSRRGTPRRVRARRRAVPRAAPCAGGTRRHAPLADAAGPDLRRRAARPGARDRRARPAARPDRLRELAGDGERRARLRCARWRAARRRTPRGRLGPGARHAHRRRGDPPALRRRARRRTERDAPAVRRRLHDFERILPGPDRMYPDTDSPPTRVTRERVAAAARALPEPPWRREARYGAAGVPRHVAHYLIRRGGAALVDRVVREAGADLRGAAFFFGERVKGLRRAGVEVERIGAGRWVELFRAFAARPVRRDAWELLVRRLASRPDEPVAGLLGELGLDAEATGWHAMIARWVAAAREQRVR